MRDDRFKIFVQRLKDGEVEAISESFEPAFIDVEEDELSFSSPVEIEGEAFVSGENFILRLAVQTEANMQCSICNEQVSVPLKVPPFVHTQKIVEIKSGLFQMEELLREAILLQIPSRAECNEGNCPERESIKVYFSKET